MASKICLLCETPIDNHKKGDIIVTMLDGKEVTFPEYLKLKKERDDND